MLMLVRSTRTLCFNSGRACLRCCLQDAAGLITTSRAGLPDYVERFARREAGAAEGAGLLDVVRSVQPTILLGLAGATGRATGC